MNKYYYTFGTNPRYPYGINDFVEISARTMYESECVFRKHYPDRTSGTLNCAFVYTEDEFNQIRNRYYGDSEPVEKLSAKGLTLSDTEKALVLYEMSGSRSAKEYLSTLGESDRSVFMSAIGMPEDMEEEDQIEMA